MKVLFLSFYFSPDLSAGSFRATALLSALQKLEPELEIDVITTLPNRYRSYSAAAPLEESIGCAKVVRIPLPAHRGGMVDQSVAFIRYFHGALRHSSRESYDLIFVTSGRLMSTVLGALIARKKDAALYLDIRDIFVDTIEDVLPRNISWALAPIFSALEKWSISRAIKVNLVSPGFYGYFNRRYPAQRFSFFTNGIDAEFMDVAPARAIEAQRNADVKPIIVMYAGNLGEGQGLHQIIPTLAKAVGSAFQFKIVGDGGRKTALADALSKVGVSNVELLSPVSRDALREMYRTADVLFLHLNDYDAFRKVIPSKIFEYAASGKPIWAGVAGYAAEFIRAEIPNAAVFSPCNVPEAISSFDSLAIGIFPRTDFVKKFSREKIMLELARDILMSSEEKQCFRA